MRLHRLLGLALLAAALTQAAPPLQALQAVAFHQRLGQTLPAGIEFVSDRGQAVTLAALASEQPLILVMSWFDCPNLCPMVLDDLAAATRVLDLPAEAYRVAVVSIAPEESPVDARRLREHLQRRQGTTVAGWQFLTGEERAIAAATRAVGFDYTYDAQRDTYAHPAGLVVIAPGGTISRYLFNFGPGLADLKLALVDAGRGELGSLSDQVLLRCYRFDPETGRYSLTVMGVVQVVGSAFGVLLAGLLLILRIRERK